MEDWSENQSKSKKISYLNGLIDLALLWLVVGVPEFSRNRYLSPSSL